MQSKTDLKHTNNTLEMRARDLLRKKKQKSVKTTLGNNTQKNNNRNLQPASKNKSNWTDSPETQNNGDEENL